MREREEETRIRSGEEIMGTPGTPPEATVLTTFLVAGRRENSNSTSKALVSGNLHHGWPALVNVARNALEEAVGWDLLRVQQRRGAHDFDIDIDIDGYARHAATTHIERCPVEQRTCHSRHTLSDTSNPKASIGSHAKQGRRSR